MKPALGKAGRAALAACRRADALLAFDFDGTLAPLVADPARAALRPTTRRLLARLARRLPCAVLSGRSATDLRGRLKGIALAELVGNHGADFGLDRTQHRRALARARVWRKRLATRLAGRAGLQLEDQGLSLAVHFRRARDRPAARRAIRRAIAELSDAKPLDGRFVVNVLPARSADKGHALAALARRRGARWVLYVGDDVTDESAFAAPLGRCFLPIRVGSTPARRGRKSAATYLLPRQADIDALLSELLRSRTASSATTGR